MTHSNCNKNNNIISNINLKSARITIDNKYYLE